MTQQSLGDRIAQARREKGVRERRDISQLDVARAIGVSGAAVSQWESGERVPREDALGRLATYLQVSPGFLRYGLSEPNPLEDRKFTEAELAAVQALRNKLAPPQITPKRKRNGE